MKILVFTEGTVIMHSALIDDFKSYIPNGNAVRKLQAWKNQGAEIYYLTSRTVLNEINDIRFVLKKYNFPDSAHLFFRTEGKEYKDVAELIMPDIFIEDDCASIGGAVEMTYPHIRQELQKKIKSIVIKEFGGIDHLPENTLELSTFQA